MRLPQRKTSDQYALIWDLGKREKHYYPIVSGKPDMDHPCRTASQAIEMRPGLQTLADQKLAAELSLVKEPEEVVPEGDHKSDNLGFTLVPAKVA